jgi:hypothetical protein
VCSAGVRREGECSVIWIVQIFSHILDEQLVVQDGVVLAERTMKKNIFPIVISPWMLLRVQNRSKVMPFGVGAVGFQGRIFGTSRTTENQFFCMQKLTLK